MNMISRLLKRLILVIITIYLGASFSYAQDLRLTNQKGVVFRSKPSLSQRISGVKKVYVFYPMSPANNDRYIYQNFIVYLQQLGLTVVDRGLAYEQVDASQGTVSGYILSCSEDISQYVQEVNSLAVVLNIGHFYGQYIESTTVTFNFMDWYNKFVWIVQIRPERRAERYIRQCQSNICSSYSFNSSYACQPPYVSSNYTQDLLRSYLDKGEHSAIEGIYEGDDYTLGVKKGTDGKYYLIYHSSKHGADGWRDGFVKAELRETATSGVYRATWYGKSFQKMDYKIIFEKGMFTAYNEDNDKDLFLKMYPTGKMEAEQASMSTEWSGTGFALNNGYIVTNCHVVDDAKSIVVYGVKGQNNKGYNAEVVATDKTNDLAIIKISDYSFNGFGTIPYAVKNQALDVGEDVWVLGYPLTQYLGNEIKLTNGIVSSKSGYKGDVSTYQISAPVQPGNSGGPLFDTKGNIVGIVNAGVPGAENVGYAIKTSYLFNLADIFSVGSSLPSTNSISSLTLKDQVKKVNSFIFLLMCSLDPGSSSSHNTGTSRPSSSSCSSSFPHDTKVINSKDATIYVGDRIGACLSEGTVDTWEISSDAMQYVAPTSNGTITAVKSGNVSIWGYINGSPKLFRLHIASSGTYVPHDKGPNQVTTKDFSMYVGEHITAKISDGEVTIWEVENHNRDYISANGNVLTARKAGYVNVWGYVNSSPKLFKITIISK